MSKEKKYKWIIVIHNIDKNKFRLMKMKATKKKMKKKLLDLIKSDRTKMRKKFEYYDWGIESVDKIQEKSDKTTGELKELRAFACYRNCTIEYKAIVSNMIETLEE